MNLDTIICSKNIKKKKKQYLSISELEIAAVTLVLVPMP